ncbi:MAG: glycosyltransferase family 1 protein [Patescibacteria group bacterium]
MLIGIDARFFGPKAKGLGRYTQKLIEELEQTDKQNDYLVFLRRVNFNEYQPQNPRFKKVWADYRWYSLGEQLFFPWQLYRHRIDLMHFTHFNVPIFYRRPLVLTIHDLILQRWPTRKDNFLNRVKYFFKSLGYKIVIRSALARAQKIIAVSRFVKGDIVKSFGVVEERIAVIYEGAPEIANRQALIANREILEKYKIHKPYLLYVGNAYPHKNLARLAEAFKILRSGQHPDLQLVFAGGDDYFYQKLKKENCDSGGVCFGGGVIFAGFVPEEELRNFYANASLYVFPSLCEGFGLPPLEAMAQGVAVVTSCATCLPEILGQAVHYFDGENPVDMAAKINEVLTDEALRQQLIRQGFEQIKKYSWRQMAEETQKIYAGRTG